MTGSTPLCCACLPPAAPGGLTDIANGIKVAGSSWGATALGLLVVALAMAFRRWRHLLVFLCSLFFLEIVGHGSLLLVLSRPRPYGVRIIASWGGYSAPSPPAAALTIFLIGAVYCLVVPGRPRTYARRQWPSLPSRRSRAVPPLPGADHPTTSSSASCSASPSQLTAFRFFTPTRYSPSSTGAAAPPTWM